MKRIRGPKKEFRFTGRQKKLVFKMASVPNKDLDRAKMREFSIDSGYGPQTLPYILENEHLFLCAKYIREKMPFVICSVNQPGPKGRKWSEQMERFCWEIAGDIRQNTFEAARRAGYPDPKYGSKLIGFDSIKQRLKEIRQERSDMYKADANSLIEDLINSAKSNMSDYIDEFDGNTVKYKNSNEISRDQMSNIRKIKKTIMPGKYGTKEMMELQLEDKTKARALAMKHLGLLEDSNTIDPRQIAQDIRDFAEESKDMIPGGDL